MSKVISPAELAQIVSDLLTKPETVGELDEKTTYTNFLSDVARLVCYRCGGDVGSVSDPDFSREDAEKAKIEYEEDQVSYMVHIHGNDCLPDPKKNIWTHHGFDPDGDLFD